MKEAMVDDLEGQGRSSVFSREGGRGTVEGGSRERGAAGVMKHLDGRKEGRKVRI